MTDTTADLLSEARRRLPAARDALAAATGDIPPAGGSGGGSGTSDRTGRLALAIIDGTDNAVTDSSYLDRLEKICIARCKAGQDIDHQLRQILDICDRWAPDPRRKAALDANLRAAAEGKGDDGCNSHARVKDHKGVPRYEERHPGLAVCQTCHRDLRRVRARDRYADAVMVPLVVVQWRERHPGKNLSDAILDRLLAGVVA